MTVYVAVATGINNITATAGSIIFASDSPDFGACNCSANGGMHISNGCHCFAKITISDAPSVTSVAVYTEPLLSGTPSAVIKKNRYRLNSATLGTTINEGCASTMTWAQFQAAAEEN